MIKTIRKFQFPRIVANFRNREKIILRDFLALERTALANERTLFSYVRVSLYLILTGIAFLKLEQFSSMLWAAYLAFGLSALLLVVGMVRYRVLKKRLGQFYDSIDFQDEESK